MANEAVIVELLGQPKGEPIRFTVANATGIEKGTLMSGAEPRTAVATAGQLDGFVGIAATEKVASDGQTTLGLWTKGIFDLKTVTTVGPEGAIGFGDAVVMSGANIIRKATTNETSGAATFVVGRALETASAGETITVAVGIY